MQSGTNKLKAPVSTVIDEAAGLALWLPVSRRLLQVGRAAPDQAPVTPVALPPTLPASELQGEHMGGRTLGEAGESPLGAATPGHPGPPHTGLRAEGLGRRRHMQRGRPDGVWLCVPSELGVPQL